MEERELPYTVCGNVNWYSQFMELWKLWKTIWKLFKKLKIHLPYDPAISLLDIYLEKMKTLTQKDTCTPVFIAAPFIIGKTWKQPKCLSTIQRLMDKEYIYIYTPWNINHL